jgi:hypothetical protein
LARTVERMIWVSRVPVHPDVKPVAAQLTRRVAAPLPYESWMSITGSAFNGATPIAIASATIPYTSHRTAPERTIASWGLRSRCELTHRIN